MGVGFGPSGLVSRVRKSSPTWTTLWDDFDTDGIGAPQSTKIGRDRNILVVGKFVTGNHNGSFKTTLTGTRLWGLTLVPSATAGDLSGDSFGNTYLVHGLNSGAPATCIVKKLDPLGTQVFSLSYAIGGTCIEVGTDEWAVVGGFLVNSQVYSGLLVPSPDLIVDGVTSSIGPFVGECPLARRIPIGRQFLLPIVVRRSHRTSRICRVERVACDDSVGPRVSE